MKKLLVGLFSGLVIAFSDIPVKADIDIGVTLQAGRYETSGHEKEKNNAGDEEKNSKSIEETFYGGSVYIEAVADSGFTLGIDWVPTDIELGSGSRTDSDSGESSGDDDTGDRTASADLSNLITLYANIPLFGGGGNVYGLVGVHHGDIKTTETLQTSTYPDATVTGYQIGLGYRAGKLKTQLYYSDFGDIAVESDQNNGQGIRASADVLAATLSYGF